MKVGIVGLPRSGKTTLFRLLTGTQASSRQDSVGMAKVPDQRVDFLTGMFKPKKTIYAQIEVIDLAGADMGDKGFAKMINPMRNVDALVNVVRCFDSLETGESATPVSDASALTDELILADMALAETRVNRLESAKKRTSEEEAELLLMKKLVNEFGEGRSMREISLSEEEKESLRGFGMLSLKPVVIVANMSDEQFSNGEYPDKDKLNLYCKERDIPFVELAAQIEVEISQLPEDERGMFMEEYGIDETGVHKVARAIYSSLGMISFFTVGEDEVRAWPIADGTVAKKAAGKIHTDIEKAFLTLMIQCLKGNDQLFFTTHNTDILDLPLPKHTFTFFKKDTNDDMETIKCINVSDFLKRSTDSVKNAAENDLFSVAPSMELIYELEKLK